MAERDEPFLAWLSEQAGPLNALQSKVVLTALVELLHLAPPAVRRDTHGFFSKFWTATYLGGGGELDRIAKKVRGPIRRGRPRGAGVEVPAQYLRLLRWAEELRTTNPTLNEFRRALTQLHDSALIPMPRGPVPSAHVHRLYLRLDKHPERLAFEILRLITGKAVKTLHAHIRPNAPPRAAASAS